ncbi:MAG: hypothetical protein FJW38_17905 [Acidobacteria bacterium]|nr:hypothetical protein [Acidobacteriota bacterium]
MRWLALFLPLFAQQDLRLTYEPGSQPYRVYAPAQHATPVPLVIALHGTGGDQNTLLDTHRTLKTAADRFGVIVVAPHGRGVTEYRGIGEEDVLTVLNEVRKRFVIDPERIYLTGHSMGGTGSAYLAMRHPDTFAAYAPLAAAYSFPWLARNSTAVPSLWTGGAADAEYYHRGVAVGIERMRKFGANVTVEVLPGEGHDGPVKDFERVFAWLLKHKRDLHPRRFTYETDTPLHGCAFWTCIDSVATPGRMATIVATAPGGNRAEFVVDNVAEFTFIPDATFLDVTRPVNVAIGGKTIWSAPIPIGQRLRFTHGWTVALEDAAPRIVEKVARTTHKLDMLGDEKPLANWIADAMRRATGADIALYGGWAYRGLPLPEGAVDIVDLIQCSRPFDQYLVTVKLTGYDIERILDDNVPHPKKDQPLRIDSPGASRLVQVSGMKYVFDPAKPDGYKILSSTLDPDRIYTVVLEGQVVERESMLLAGRFRRLDYKTTEIPLTLALYGHASGGTIHAAAEGRVTRAQPAGSR